MNISAHAISEKLSIRAIVPAKIQLKNHKSIATKEVSLDIEPSTHDLVQTCCICCNKLLLGQRNGSKFASNVVVRPTFTTSDNVFTCVDRFSEQETESENKMNKLRKRYFLINFLDIFSSNFHITFFFIIFPLLP